MMHERDPPHSRCGNPVDLMASRLIDLSRVTSEEQILSQFFAGQRLINTTVETVKKDELREFENTGQMYVGVFRSANEKNMVTADAHAIMEGLKAFSYIPSFVVAGPRKKLAFDPARVRVAIVTTGGLAPGLNEVVHSIVHRHFSVYGLRADNSVLGIRDSFKGLCSSEPPMDLKPGLTEEWLGTGGSKLGNVRWYRDGTTDVEAVAREASERLADMGIDILYVAGGDGSMRVAHAIAGLNPDKSIACLPKTMDNDILWVDRSFGFATAVEHAARVIDTIYREAEATRRISVVTLFGAESGFVAASATLASGHVDLVLIPEVFTELAERGQLACDSYWSACLDHLRRKCTDDYVSKRIPPHAMVVVAEGVCTVLFKKGLSLGGVKVPEEGTAKFISGLIHEHVANPSGGKMEPFWNEPRHYIRAVPANASDRVYCEQLGALAVDSALAGYTDFAVSRWKGEYVLVPLALITEGQKTLPLVGSFWKHVVNSTEQPSHEDSLEPPMLPETTAGS